MTIVGGHKAGVKNNNNRKRMLEIHVIEHAEFNDLGGYMSDVSGRYLHPST